MLASGIQLQGKKTTLRHGISLKKQVKKIIKKIEFQQNLIAGLAGI